MMPLTLANVGHVASLDVYSSSLLMVDSINHTSSKIINPSGYQDHFPEQWTRVYLHNSRDVNFLQVPNLGRVSLISFVDNLNMIPSGLWCINNLPLKVLNVSGSSEMPSLNCGACDIRILNIKGVPLTSLNCEGNALLSSLDLSQIDPNFDSVICDDCNFTSLGVTASFNSNVFHCFNNKLTSLEITFSGAVVSGAFNYGPSEFFCQNNFLTTLDVSKCGRLTNFDCRNNLIVALNLSHNNNLQSLNCSFNTLTSLNISGSRLAGLDCSNNNLPQSQIDGILMALTQSMITYGITVGSADLSDPDGHNAFPGPNGITARTLLTDNDWSVKDSSGTYP